MSDKPRRLYNDKEIGALLKRATELQEAAHESHEHHLSLEEISQIAEEIGIAPQHLLAAAAELEGDLTSDEGFLFWPRAVRHARVVKGTLTEAEWEQFVLKLRRETGSTGRVGGVGQIREWSRPISDLGALHVSLSPQGEQTLLEVRQNYPGGTALVYVASLTAAAGVASILMDGSNLSDLMSLAIAGGTGLGGLAAARVGIGMWVKKQRERVRHLTNRLHDVLAPPPQVAAPEPLIDLPEDEAERAAAAVHARQRVKS